VAAQIQCTTFTTNEEWIKLIAAAPLPAVSAAETLAEGLQVTIEE